MALVLADRVQETTVTTGTGTITLAGAVAGYQSFSVIGNGNTTYYCVTSGTDWEIGVGTYTALGTTLARTTILASSAAGAAISLANTSLVFCVYPASRAVYEEADGSVILNVNSSTDALRITQTGTGNALVVEDETNPDSTPFVINAVGQVAIGTTTFTAGRNVINNRDITGATTSSAFNVNSTIQSDVTSTGQGYQVALSTAAAVFTTNIRYYQASQGTFGAGSTVTNQYAFITNSNLIGATNNYGFYHAGVGAAITAGKTVIGFYTDQTAATGGGTAYSFYAQGTAPNVFNGSVNIGNNGIAGTNFYNTKTITGAVSSYANLTSATIQSDVTNVAAAYVSGLSTAAASFTLPNIRHFQANQGTIGAGSTVTNQAGFITGTTNFGATNNYGFYFSDVGAANITAGKTVVGFYSDLAAATGGGTAWTFYGSGTAPNYFNGTVSIGTTTSSAKLTVRNDSAAAISNGLVLQNASGSAIGTGTALYFDTNGNGTVRAASIQSAQTTAGNWADLRFFTAAGSTPAEAARITGTTQFLLGATSSANSSFLNARNITGGGNAHAFNASATIQSDVTTAGYGFVSSLSTSASAFTTSIRHFQAAQGTIGAGSTVTNQYGFITGSSNVGATNNYGYYFTDVGAANITAGKTVTGFYSDLAAASGGGSSWCFYGSGTAQNWFNGNVGIGASRSTPTVALDVNGAMTLRAPSTVNAATYTVAATDSSLRFTTTNCTVTLPAAASFTGRILYLNTITANSVTSASSNVIPLGSNTAGTAIFPATAGKFAMIQSDGTNWITMMAN